MKFTMFYIKKPVFINTWLFDKFFKDFLITKVNPHDTLGHTFRNACSVFISEQEVQHIFAHENQR